MAVPQNALTAIDFLTRNAGLSRAQAAGLVGNLLVESGSRIDPRAVNPRDGRDGSDSIGIAQWNSTRAQALRNFAAERGRPVNDLETQLAYLVSELNGPERRAGERLRAAQTPDEAARAAVSFFRPAGYNIRTGDPSAVPSLGSRVGWAQTVMGGGMARPGMTDGAPSPEGLPGPAMAPQPMEAPRMNGQQFAQYVGNNSPSTSNNPALAFQEDQNTIRDGFVAGRPDIRSPNTPPAGNGLEALGRAFARQQGPAPVTPVYEQPFGTPMNVNPAQQAGGFGGILSRLLGMG
jgi:hypothetical protein